ncbi:AzlD domain-containing protein [Desulfuribacillus alkaliarsenatis]|uniref:Branched chain amino acid ABC transporter n=1 Tax=Desulfuribacillus alkaliarsenatis TaxID=766136 RepID=A0A1E5G2K0_9FIRM|nr:AzlD domain-containing protein [Desulfuribacillus alkaliarsenatis]OEF97206.1 branched chain amino acid ABC transporter [Desulfuribacillus alkaliarsenatis]
METYSTLVWVILGMAVVTYVPRMIPMVYLSDREIPSWLNEWLGYIPVTVLAALLFPILFMENGSLSILQNPYLLAALPTFIVGFWTKNIFITVLVGMASVVAIRFFI